MPTADENTATVDLYSDYGIIIDATNGKILASASSDTPFSPASMAKVMTLIVACEKLTEADLAKQIDYTEYYDTYDYNGLSVAFSTLPMNTASLPGGTSSPLRIVIKDILYGIGVLSAGDCCLMIAEYTYGSLDAFVEAMNQKALDLGLTQTKFVECCVTCIRICITNLKLEFKLCILGININEVSQFGRNLLTRKRDLKQGECID
jgi:D-alanyl-D-alanine carboxypeptidase (penicillin-binding protein 5/6)